MSKAKEYGEQLYDAAVLTVGAVGVSFVSAKLTKDSLGVPMTPIGATRLAIALVRTKFDFGKNAKG